MATIDEMKGVASEIRGATQEGSNTAYKVGNLFYDIIEHLNEVGIDGEGVLNQPLLNINSINSIGSYKDILICDRTVLGASKWKLSQLSTEVSTVINNNTTLQNTIKSLVSVNPVTLSGETVKIATINGTSIYAPKGGSSTSTGDSSLTFTNRLTTGTRIVTINGTDIFAPSGSGGSGSGGGESYDDSEVKRAIQDLESAVSDLNDEVEHLDDTVQALNSLSDSELERLQNLINDIDAEIRNEMKDALKDATWIQNNFPEGIVTWQAGWNDSIQAYLSRVGLWKTDESTTQTFWSDIKQNWNSIKTQVSAFTQGDDFTELLQSAINQGIADGTVVIDLSTTYARKGAEDVIAWMYSALKSSTSSDLSFNDIISAGSDGINNAISEVRTVVNKVKNGDVWDYVAESSLESKVNGAITGLYNKASANDATTTIFSKVKQHTDDIAGIIAAATDNSSGVDIAAKFANYRSGASFRSSVDSAIASLITTSGTTSSGLITKSTLDASLAELVTNNQLGASSSAGVILKSNLDNAVAELLNKVANNASGITTSSSLEGAMAEIFSKSGDVIASVVTKVNESGSSVKIHADKIDLTDGTTFVRDIFADYANVDDLTARSAYINALTTDSLFVDALTSNTIKTALIEAIEDDLTISADKINIGENSSGVTKYITDMLLINAKNSSWSSASAFYNYTSGPKVAIYPDAMYVRGEANLQYITADTLDIGNVRYTSYNVGTGMEEGGIILSPTTGIKFMATKDYPSAGVQSGYSSISITWDKISVPGNGVITSQGTINVDGTLKVLAENGGRYPGATGDYALNNGKYLHVINGIVVGVDSNSEW